MKQLLLCVIILICIIVFYVWLLKARVSTGVLYMVGDDNPVCVGTTAPFVVNPHDSPPNRLAGPD